MSHANKRHVAAALASARDVASDKPAAPLAHYAALFSRCSELGASPTHLAMIAAKNRSHAGLNPYAQYRIPLEVEEVLADAVIHPPLTRPMCSPITDGAAAVVVCSDAYARNQDLNGIHLASCTVRSAGPVNITTATAAEAYEEAGVGPRDIDVFEVHDAAATAELLAYVDLGVCKDDDIVRTIEMGCTTIGGRRPVNPSGGLLSRGHALAATGLAQVVELVWQLRGAAGQRQVAGARVGCAHSAGGLLGGGNAACVVTILHR